MRSVIIDLIKTTIKKIFKLPLLLEFFFLTIPEIGSIEYSNSFFFYIYCHSKIAGHRQY